MNEHEKRRVEQLLRLFSNADLAEFRVTIEKLRSEEKSRELAESALELIAKEERIRDFYRLNFRE